METDDPRQHFYSYKRKLKNGKEVWYFKIRDPLTREILPGRSSHHTNINRARTWAEHEYARLAAAPSGMLVREFVAPFYSEACAYVRKQRNVKGLGEKARKQKRKYVEDYLLNCEDLMAKRLADVTRLDLEAFRDDYLVGERFDDEPCRTSQAVMEVVKTVFGQAVEGGLMLQNPAYRLPTGKYEAIERKALSEEDLDAVLRRGNYGSDRQHRATMIAATTGMRAGEVRGLKWKDLDPKRGIIHIERALKNESSVVGPPKWGKRRICPYPVVLQELLESLRGEGEAYVFAWGEEETLNYGRWKNMFYRACEKAGVSTTLHGLRHTLNTCLLIRGIPDAVIRAALGWSDPKIQAQYSHISFGLVHRSPIIDSVIRAIQGKARVVRKKSPKAHGA